jgi:dinuclear metal center YbgI/SA1388 family protein
MSSIHSILSWLRSIAPETSALEGDPVGHLIDLDQKEIGTIGVCLDATPSMVSQSSSDGVQLLISHHPLIYRPLKRICYADPISDSVIRLIKGNISLYSMHTNWDNASGGINDTLSELVGIEKFRPITTEGDAKLIRIGNLDEALPVSRLAKRIELALNATGQSSLRYNLDLGDRTVRTLAICGGAGGSFIGDVIAAGADAYLTADVKWDQFVFADGQNFPVFDAGHGATERPGMQALANRLTNEFSDVAVKFYR